MLKAYAEVDKILSLMEAKYVEKVPEKLRKLFKEKKLDLYEPIINIDEPLDKQNLQRTTLVILAMLNVNYWCDREERQKLLKIYSENDEKREQKIRKMYNPDNLFKKKN